MLRATLSPRERAAILAEKSPPPWGGGGPRPALSPAGAGRVRGIRATLWTRMYLLSSPCDRSSSFTQGRTPHPPLRRTLSPRERAVTHRFCRFSKYKELIARDRR